MTLFDPPFLRDHNGQEGEMEKFIVSDDNDDEVDSKHLVDSRKPLKKHTAAIILWLLSLIAYIDRYALSGVLSEIKIYFNVGNTEVAVLQTVFVISYLAFAPLIGYLGDKLNRKYLIIIATLLEMTSVITGSFVQDSSKFNFLLASRMLLGIAECILNVIIFPFIADLYPVEQRSFIIQVICTATPIGSGLGYILGSWAASHFGGWFYALRITPIFSAFFVILAFICLPVNVERGAMEPEIVKNAQSYKEDLVEISKISSYRSITLGCICSTMMTGVATVFFPDFVSLAGVVSGTVSPCVQPPCEYTQFVFRLGVITILAGFGGALFGIYGTKMGHARNNELIEAELCGFGCLLAGFSVYMVMEFSTQSAMITWIFSFLVIFGVSINWGLSVELVIKVTSPKLRSTAKAFFHLISHSLGDAPSPLIIGSIADYYMSKEPVESYIGEFNSLKKAFYFCIPMCLLGGLFFLHASLNLLFDRDQLRRKDLKKTESIQLASYTNDNANI